LDSGADVNAANPAGLTPLHQAARVLRPALAHELIAHGARRDVRDENGKTPLDIAHEAASQDAASLFLLRHDAIAKLLQG
jgi:ankyrin repeat protein